LRAEARDDAFCGNSRAAARDATREREEGGGGEKGGGTNQAVVQSALIALLIFDLRADASASSCAVNRERIGMDE